MAINNLAEIKTQRESKLEALRVQRKAIMAEIQEQSKALFEELVPEIFKEHPKLKSFSWTQYTPYFNDGDTCSFRAYTDDPRIQFGDEEEREEYYFANTERVPTGNTVEDRYDWRTPKRQIPEMVEVKKVHTPEELEKNSAYTAVRDLLSTFEETDYEQMFGDHVEVIVTPDGVEVEEYSHD